MLTVQTGALERPEKNRHGIGVNVASRTDTVPAPDDASTSVL